jgi:hypothetical protein
MAIGRTLVSSIWMVALVPTSTLSGGLPEGVEVAPVWAGHPVGFSIATSMEFQYVGFYDPDRRMTVAQRRVDSTEWKFTTLPSRVEWDSHNSIVLEVDSRGYVHVSGNMHNDRLVYFRSLGVHDISTFERPRMVGNLEQKVTYPQFLKDADGRLYFQYRHGKSGAGLRILNRYDADSRTWSRLLSGPLFDGQGEMSAYLTGPALGPDGYFHLLWMWRDTPLGSTNHDLSYARSSDLMHWENVEGEPVSLPLQPRSPGVVVDPVRSGEGLVGIAFGVGWDTRDRPIASYCKYGPDGYSQWFNARREGNEWRVVQTSSWKYRWDLEHTGAGPWHISATPIAIDEKGRLTQTFDHIEEGRGTWILDEETLRPIASLGEPEFLRRLRKVESTFAEMEVRELVFDRQGEYFLRWETLPRNRDRPRKRPHPPPSMLRVYRRLPSPSAPTENAPATEAGTEAEDLEVQRRR